MQQSKHRARALRSSLTEAERKLWGYLRKRTLQGFRFNRQVPVGPFIVDFMCRNRRLVIEVDGATHGSVEEISYDLRRTQYLRDLGYAVYRASNDDILHEVSAVLDGILWALEERPVVFAPKIPLRPSGTSPNELGEGK